MEKFKIDIFKKENKNLSFPNFQKVAMKDCTSIKLKFIEKTGLGKDEHNNYKILKIIREKSKPVPGVNADAIDFNFILLIEKLRIKNPEYVNIHWTGFDDIDKFKLRDFSDNLRYIWYPGPDDVEIFPDDVSWIISIDEMGSVYFI